MSMRREIVKRHIKSGLSKVGSANIDYTGWGALALGLFVYLKNKDSTPDKTIFGLHPPFWLAVSGVLMLLGIQFVANKPYLKSPR